MKKNFKLLTTFLMLLGLSLSQGAWGETVRIYCKTPSWWNTDGAGCSIHYWGVSGKSTSWPGARMSQVSGTSDVWYIDLDKANFTSLKFARVTGSGTLSYLSAQTGNLTLDSDAGKRLYTISNSSGCWDSDKCTCSGSWGKYAPTGAVCGGWNSWNPATDPFINGVANITLAAGTTQYFKVMLGSTYYGNNGTMTIDNCTGWDMTTSGGNCGITTYGAGNYQFVYNSSTSKLTVYYPYFVSSHGSGEAGKLPDLTGSPGTYQFTCNNGIYSKTCNNASAGAKVYRITRKNAWESTWEDDHHPDNSQSSSNITVTESSSTNRTFTTAKVSNITIYFNPSTMKTWVNATPVNLITYDKNGASSGTVPVDDAASIKVKGNSGNLAKNGYTFNGWNTAANGSGTHYDVNADFNPSSSTTLYAEWTPTTYTITYKDQSDAAFSGTWGSGSHPANYNIETATITLDQPTKTGYRFDGWFTASDCSGSAVTQIAKGSTGNKTFYAKWTKYAPNGAIIGTMNDWNPTTHTLTDGSVTINLTASTTPYEFKVLYGTDYYGNNGTMYRNNCSGWTMETNKNNCKILADKTGDYVFAWNNSTKKLSVTYAESSTRTIYLDYSNFTGWEGGTSGFKVGDYNGDDKNMVKVNDCNNDYLYSAQVGTIDVPYVFKRISKNTGQPLDEISVIITTSNNACKVTNWKAGSASSVILNYSVTYDMKDHGTQIDAGCVQSGGTVTKPTDPTATGWEFGGWYKETELTNAWNFSSDVVTQATTLYAKWIATHTVTVAVNDAKRGTVSPTSATNVGAVTKSADITATPNQGYFFKGWTIPDGVTLAEGTEASATIKIYATADSKTITANFAPHYAVRGALNDGSGNGGMPGMDNTTPLLFNGGWQCIKCTLQANTTYKMFIYDTLAHVQHGNDTENTTIANFGAAGYTPFTGTAYPVLFTTRSAGVYTIDVAFNGTVGALIPKVQIKDIPASSQITFGVNDANMGAVTAMANSVAINSTDWVANGSTVVITATPKTGYEFYGWYTSTDYSGVPTSQTNPYTITNINSSRTLYAKFQPKTYMITYKDQGNNTYSGDNLSSLPTSHSYGTATNLVNGVKSTYVFEGWYTSQDCSSSAVTSLGATAYTSNITLYAKWRKATPIKIYFYNTPDWTNVTYHAWGGTLPSTESPYPDAVKETRTHDGHTIWSYSFYEGERTNVMFLSKENQTYRTKNLWNLLDNNGRCLSTSADLQTATWIDLPSQNYKVTFGYGSNGTGVSATVDGAAITSNSYVDEGKTITFTATAATGYKLKEWNTAQDGTGTQLSTDATYAPTATADMTVYAIFELETYTITYKDKDNADYSGNNSASLPKTHTYGTATVLVNGAKDGFTFDGWYEDAACATTPVSEIGATAKTANFTLYAKWSSSAVYYAITKGVNDANMGTVSSNAADESSVLAGTTITFTATPNTGYEVEGWYTNAECTEGKSDAGQLNHDVVINSNKTVYVKFKYIDYTVTNVANKPAGCSPTIGSITTSQDLTKVHHGVSFSITATPTVLSRFMGWTSSDNTKVTFENANSATTNVTVTGNNVTIYANFDGRYAMRGGYKDREGTGGMPPLTNTTPIYGTTWGDVRYTLEANTTYAFRLVDLADNEQNYGMPAASGIAGTINLDNDYFTTFVAGNITYLTTRGAGSYQFQLCATTEGTIYPRMKVVATGTQPLSLQIPYGVNDAVMGSISATANGIAFDKNKWVATGDNVVFTAAPNTGYEIEGWYGNSGCTGTKLQTGGTTYTINNIQAAQTVYVKYKAIVYTITYKDQNDEAFSGAHESGYPTTHTYGKETKLKKATKKAYVFEGWYTDAACSVGYVTSLAATAYTSNITLYAKWRTASMVKIYYYNMYDWNAVRCHGYGGTLGSMAWPGVDATLETLTRDGHTVWSYSFYEGEYEKIKFNAKSSDKLQTGLYINATANDGRCAYFDKALAPDTCWWGKLPIQNYRVTFDANGHGTAPAAVWVDKDSTVTAPAAPSATGYDFGGWYKEAGCTNEWDFDEDTIKATTTIFAKWTPTQYTITYHANDGVAVPEGSYTIETATFSLPTTTKVGSSFDGWYDNAELTGSAITQIALGSYGNKEFWAKWKTSNIFLEGRARVKDAEGVETTINSGSGWNLKLKTIPFIFNSADSMYYLNTYCTVLEQASPVGGGDNFIRLGIANGEGAVTPYGCNTAQDYLFLPNAKGDIVGATNGDVNNKSFKFRDVENYEGGAFARRGPVMYRYNPKNNAFNYCAPLLTFAYAGVLQTMKDYTIAIADASITSDGLSDSTITYQYKLDDGAWQTWSSDIVAAEGTYKLRATASGHNEFGQAVSGVVSNEITITVYKPAIEAEITHVNDVATDDPIVRVNDNFTMTPTVTNVPDDQTVQVCYKWITVPAGSSIDKSKNIFERVGETSAAKATVDVAGDYKIRVYVTSSDVCPDLGIKWDSTDIDVNVKGDEITVYAKIDKGITDWENKYIYYWKNAAGTWPGHEMNYIGKDSVDYEWYSYNIVGYKAYQGGNLLFNDGTDKYGQYQTNNVAMPVDDEFYFIKTAISSGKRNVTDDPHIDVTRRVILLTDTTALYQYVTIDVEGKGIFFANREEMTYTYTLTSKPDGSTATLNAKHQLTPDMAGNYVVTIRCEAGDLDAENSFVLRVQPNPVTLTASAGASANIGATTTLTVASSQSISGLYKTFTVIEPGANDPITFQSGTTSATSNSYSLLSSGTYTFAVVLTDNEGVIAGKAQCSLTVNPKTYYISHHNQSGWQLMTYSEADGVYTCNTLKYYSGSDAYLTNSGTSSGEWHVGINNPDDLSDGSDALFVYDVTMNQVTVYALNKRLYRIKSICGGNTYYSNAMTNDGDAISFFAQKGGQLVWQERATAAAEWEDQAVVVTTTATESGVYTATPTIKAASFTLTAYTGTLTIFSQLTKNAMSTGTPTAANGQLTEFTKASAAEYYNHYWVRYISTANAQAMATVGNSINNCLATTLPYYEMPATGNVRYAYDNTTNHFSRTFLAGSGDANFLRVYGEHLDTLVAGSDPKSYTPISSLATSKKFADGSDWIYTASASGEVNATQSVTAILVTKYNNTQRWILAESGLEADENAKRVVLNKDVATPGRYNLTLIYDFKTNRLTAGAQPEPGTVITDTMLIDQLILIREGDGDATQFTLADDAKLIVVDKMTVELDVTKAMWDAWVDDGKAGSGYKYMFFWLSLPYQCYINDIYGLGVYGTKFEIQRYRGDLRALGQAGGGQATSAWRKLKGTATMEANRGYVVALKVCESDFKSAGDKQIVRLFFPSKEKVELKHEVTTSLAENEDNATSNLHWNWNIMGNPLVKTDDGDKLIDTEHEGAAELNYIYVWQWNGGARTYEPWALEDTQLKSTHSYMVQAKGSVYWNYPSASAPARYLEAAQFATAESYGNLNIRLNVSKGEKLLDKTYIRYREDGQRDEYEMGRDLEKIINSGVTQFYATANNNLAAICLGSEDKEMIPLTLIASENGEYTFSIHRQLNSNLEPTIYDAQTGKYYNLSLDNFVVDLDKGTYTNRFFFLMKTRSIVTDLDEINSNDYENGVHKVMRDGILYIIRDGKVYDGTGRLVD